MDIFELNKTRRTVRKFKQQPIDEAMLLQWIDAARVCPSAANLQPLRYRVVSDKNACADLFPFLKWAGYLPDGTPKDNEVPTAYILIAQDLSVRKADAALDAGAAAMTITLCAHENGIGCCWIGSFRHDAVRTLYALPDHIQPVLILAFGYPAQKSTEVPVAQDIRYYLDPSDTLCVPKRSLNDILL